MKVIRLSHGRPWRDTLGTSEAEIVSKVLLYSDDADVGVAQLGQVSFTYYSCRRHGEDIGLGENISILLNPRPMQLSRHGSDVRIHRDT